MPLRQFSVLKPKGGEYRPITLDTHKISIYCPIRRHQARHPLPSNIKHQTQQQQTAARIRVKGNYLQVPMLR